MEAIRTQAPSAARFTILTTARRLFRASVTGLAFYATLAGAGWAQQTSSAGSASGAPTLLTRIAPEAISRQHAFVVAYGGESYFSNPSAGIEKAPFLHGVYKALGFSSDGRYFLYLKSNGALPAFNLFMYDLSAGKEQQVGDGIVYNAVWAPVGQRFAYMSVVSGMEVRLSIYDGGSKAGEMVASGMIDPDFIEWRQDGGALLYTMLKSLTRFTFHDHLLSSSLYEYDLGQRTSTFTSSSPMGRYSGRNVITASDMVRRYELAARRKPDVSVAAGVRSFVVSGERMYAVFAGNDNLYVSVFDPVSGKFQKVANGDIQAALDEGIVVREFIPRGVRYSFMPNGMGPITLQSFTSGWVMPIQGSAYLVQGGSLYAGGACDGRVCLVIGHTLTLGYALDWQQTPEDGQGNKDILATQDGTVVSSYATVTCNSNTLNAQTCNTGVDNYSNTCNDPNGGAGNYAIIAHSDGSFSMYGHMRSNTVVVSANQPVTQGTHIGDQGHSGVAASPTNYNSCGDHVHFQRQINTQIWGQSIATDFQELPCNLSCLTAFVSENVEQTTTPASALAVTLAPSSLAAGATSNGNVVTLPAVSSTDTIVTLQAGDTTIATVPASVTVPAGNLLASFPLTAASVSGPVQTAITATTNGVNSSATLTVNSVAAALATVTPANVPGGNPSTGEIDLTGSAPSGGSTVALTSSNPSLAAIPASATIPAGGTYATFGVVTSAVSAATQVTISGTLNGVTQNAVLTLTPAVLSQVTTSPTVIYGSYQSTGNIILTGAVPADTPVSLTSSDPSVTVPASVTVSANTSSASFSIVSSPVSQTLFVTITATVGGITKSATITVKPILPASLTLYPSSVGGGNSTTSNRVTLNFAPLTSTTIALSSSDPSVVVPSSVTVAAGSTTSALFSVSTSAVSTQQNYTISGNYNGVTVSANLTVTPITLTTLTLSPATVVGGQNATANTVRINSAAPPGGAAVTLSSSSSSATVPATVTIAAGGTLSSGFTITTTPVTTQTQVTITATYGGVTQTAVLTLNPIVVSSVSLVQTGIGGGDSVANNKIILSSAAPSGGATVTLSSSNPAMTVPASVFISAGSTNSPPFTISTSTVSSAVSATLSATYNGTNSATVTVNPIQIASVTLSSGNVGGGASTTGNTVALNYAAPPGGAVVTLSSSSGTATVPSSVTVAAGSTSASFTIQTSPVSTATSVTITATYNSASQTATLMVTPPALAMITLSPASIGGGVSTTANTVTLNGPAPAGGASVALSSSNAAVASPPASVTVAAGATTASFTIATTGVSASTPVTISGSYGGVNGSVVLTVNPPVLSSITLSPPSVGGGNSTTANTVGLTAPAPAGGIVVALSSANSSIASVPSSVTVPQGSQVSNPFSITTSSVGSSTTVSISASYNGVTLPATLTVAPIVLSSIAVSPNAVAGGASTTGAVNLNVSAPAGGAVVTLSASDPSITVPASMTVAGGATASSFAIQTAAVGATVNGVITATFNGVSATAGLIVNTPKVATLTISPATIGGGDSTTNNFVTLSSVAAAGGAVITLTSSDPSTTVPATITVPAGATVSPAFTISTTAVTSATFPLISASYAGTSKSGTVTVNPILPTALTLYPTSVYGGNSTTTNRVTLNYAAPPGGLTLSLSSSDPSTTVPATLTVAAGTTTSPYFTASTTAVTATTTVGISASYGGVTRSANLTVMPIALSSLTLTASSVTGGTIIHNNTVKLNTAAPAGGAVVTLTSSDPSTTVPASVTIAAGSSTSPTFNVTTTAVSSQTQVTITATYAGSTQTANLTVN